MELDNLFEQRKTNRNQKNFNYSGYRHDDDEYSDSYQERRTGGSHYISYVINRIRANRKLRLLFIVGTIILIALIIFAIIALFPLLVKIFDYVTQNGINGILESVKGLLDKFLNGTGK
jgi:predicted RND superfamily exporter protein